MIFEQESYSNLTNVTQILEVVDTFTGGMIGLGIWILLSFGTLMVLSRYSFQQGLIAAAFMSIITSLFLAYLGLLDGEFVIISLILFVIAITTSLLIKNTGGV